MLRLWDPMKVQPLTWHALEIPCFDDVDIEP
jgi:hypothetical protein